MREERSDKVAPVRMDKPALAPLPGVLQQSAGGWGSEVALALGRGGAPARTTGFPKLSWDDEFWCWKFAIMGIPGLKGITIATWGNGLRQAAVASVTALWRNPPGIGWQSFGGETQPGPVLLS